MLILGSLNESKDVLIETSAPRGDFQPSSKRLLGTVFSEFNMQPLGGAHIIYQKLPYYDDVGVIYADSISGQYELILLEGETYDLTFSAKGYDPKQIKVEMKTSDDENSIIKDVFLSLDEANRILKLQSLTFARGRSNIGSSSFQELNALAEWLKNHDKAVIRLEGHTDYAGNAKANLLLSEQRVEKVKEYLVKHGAGKKQVKTKAFGGENPLTKERSDSAKALNRRVEVRFIKY